MTSTNFGIINDKENSKMDDEGIEAQDLATLLSRFEEATTSADDINLPKVVHRTKWNIMKAKSAGCSPAATPPATPPPIVNSKLGSVQLKTFTKTPPVLMNIKKPIQLSLLSQAIPSPISSNSTASNTFTKLSTTSLLPPKPKIHIQLNASTLRSPINVQKTNPQTQNSPKRQFCAPVTVIASNSSANNTISIVTNPQKLHFPVSITSAPKSSVELQSTNTFQPPICENKLSPDILRMPALDAASSVVKQIIPKKRTSTISVLPTSEKKIKMGSPTTTSLLLPNKQKGSALLASYHTSLPSHNLPPIVMHGSVKSSTMSTSLSQTPNVKPLVSQTEVKLTRDEHTYCWSGPVFNNKSSQGVGFGSTSNDFQKDTPITNILEEGDKSVPVSCEVLEEFEVYVDASGNDIFETDGETRLSRGIKKELPTPVPEESPSSRVVCFDTDGKANKSNRSYRKRGERWNSPVRTDKSDFFDKIPSYYTALAIPAEPIRKSVYESVSGTIGGQDHLELHEDGEIDQEEEYNKVPAHHRIFTNTSEDIEPPTPTSLSSASGVQESPSKSRGRSSRVRRISSASRHSGYSTSSHRSNRSGSRHSYMSSRSRSRSHSPSRSPSHSDHSFVEDRRGRPPTRRRNSSSQHSVSSCSSCSSNSYCSTCGASLSRSRSRSYSSDCDSRSRERSYSPGSRYSRSRSRSPRQSARRRRRVSSRSSTPEKSRSRWRSGSRSRSPYRRQRRNSFRTSSRTRRHQMKERSSAERRLMDVRKRREDQKAKAIEERRVLYVGKLPDNFTKFKLKKRFESFGEILNVRLNFRVHGDNYGFVTFAYACDAFAAKEKGNSIKGEQRFDLCFGGRRSFCANKYSDLDGNREIEEEYAPLPSKITEELDYAALLRQHVTQQKKKR